MPVTAEDVARRAGVSRATVSYVLNDVETQSISDATSDAVRRAARELGYVPNAFARSLKRGRGTTVLVPFAVSAMGPPLAQAFEACAAALARRGLTLVTDSVQYGSKRERVGAWMRLRPAVVIDAFTPRDPATARQLAQAGIASVSGSDDPRLSATQAYARHARRVQLEYLLGEGHREIVVAGPALDDGGPDLKRQLAGMARKAGAVLRFALAAGESRPDAVAGFNDDAAIAALTALLLRGVRVPEDVAVIGVDDIPLAAQVTPALTTVAGDFAPWGEALADVIIESLADPSRGRALPPLAASVVVRASA